MFTSCLSSCSASVLVMFLQYHLQTDKGNRINHLTFAFWSLKVLIFRMLSSCWTLLMIQFSTQSNKQTLRVINCGRRLTSLPRFCSSLSRSYWGWSLYSWWKQAQMKYERTSAAKVLYDLEIWPEGGARWEVRHWILLSLRLFSV